MLDHDTWLYRKDGEARIFPAGSPHPGPEWADRPWRDPLDHDGDGRKGGSLPRRKKETGK